MIEQDLFKDQGISTQQPVTFKLPDGGLCHIVEDPAQPQAIFAGCVKITRLHDNRSFIVKREALT